MPREITTHKVNGCNENLQIEVLDSAGHGGASHDYLLTTLPPGDNARSWEISFQNGPIGEVGTNGCTHEALLAIVIDRLRCFQAGPYSCRENAIALTKVEESLMWLQSRTRARAARGVEGTHQK